MESKNIKIVDEHGIDRNANVICAIDVDGSDYVVYWIERDSDNDNVFISKLLKNIDGTSSMINIDDSSEKEKMAEIVKELVKYAIDNEENKLSSKSLTLPSGKVIAISTVLFNKEQNINVQKTYITTVKKAVIKVSEDYYDVVVTEPTPVSVVEPVIQPVREEVPDIVAPVVEPVEPTPVAVEPKLEPVMNTPAVPPVIEPQVGAFGTVTPVAPVVSSVETPDVIPVSTPEIIPTPVTPVVPEVSFSQPVVEPFKVEPTPIVDAPKAPEVTPVIQTSVPSVAAPIEPAPVAVEPKVEQVNSADTANKLVFDASKESNLNQALGEASKEATIPVENIEQVREFGVEEPVTSTPAQPVSAEPTGTTSAETPVSQKAGFANNKFFMVVAIAFFLASCVFLGYEVFNYFQVK